MDMKRFQAIGAGVVWGLVALQPVGAVTIQTHMLLPEDLAHGDTFGTGIGIDGDLVAVGSARDRDNGGYYGSAYVFDRSSGNQLIKLAADDGEPFDYFGDAMAIDGSLLVAGAPKSYTDRSGAAYLFDTATGDQLFKFEASNASGEDWFGASVAISTDTVVVGAPRSDEFGLWTGSAYVFDAAWVFV